MYESMYIEDIDAKNPICTLSTPFIEHVTRQKKLVRSMHLHFVLPLHWWQHVSFSIFFHQSIQVFFKDWKGFQSYAVGIIVF